MKQKFPKYTFVHVCKNMPITMKHFENDFDAIVEGTYAQLCGGGINTTSYGVYQLKNEKAINNISWYDENMLTRLPKQNKHKAMKIVEEFEAQFCKETIDET